MELKLAGNVFDVDPERTRAYYQSNTVCTCAYCRCFREQVRARYPQMTALLERFGVDAARPDETEPYEQDGSILFAAAHYTVCGSIRQLTDKEPVPHTENGLRYLFHPSEDEAHSFPNEQEGPYFCITVRNLTLPCEWAAAPERRDRKGVLSGLKRLFRRRNEPVVPPPAVPLPADDLIIDEICDRNLDEPNAKAVRVWYSPEKTARAVLLRRVDGLYSCKVELLRFLYKEEDWIYLSRAEHPTPAMWEALREYQISRFGTEEEALRELRADPKARSLQIQIDF